MEGTDSGSVVKKIDDNQWKKITETVAACKKWLKQAKYDEFLINFPENHHPTLGYHTKCYKNFTAVPKALSSNSTSTEEFGRKQTRSESRNCNCIKHNNLKVVTSLDPSAEIKIQMAA